MIPAAATLPVQIYLWRCSPERGIAEKTFGAILAHGLTLGQMDAIAIFAPIRLENSHSR